MEANDIAWAVDNGIRSGFQEIMADLAGILRENSGGDSRIAALEAERDDLRARLEAIWNRLREDGDGSGVYSELHRDLFAILPDTPSKATSEYVIDGRVDVGR